MGIAMQKARNDIVLNLFFMVMVQVLYEFNGDIPAWHVGAIPEPVQVIPIPGVETIFDLKIETIIMFFK